MECARCHDHKYDPISQQDFYSLFQPFLTTSRKKELSAEGNPAPPPNISLTKDELSSIMTFIGAYDSIEPVKVMVMEEMKEGRQTHILNRGAYDRKEAPISPDLPKAILPFSDELAPNRLGLAQWLFDPANPLTARVAVNRLWQQCFGVGAGSYPR